IDGEVRQLVKESHETALEILQKYRPQLDAVAKKLVEIETLDMAQFEAVYTGQEPPSESDSTPSTPRPPRPAPESPAPSDGWPVPLPTGA
ncbi:MAG: cell division protein FtsH, partial [Chloroflexota bacterium]